MSYEQRDLSGTLFKNDNKEKDTHADYKGTCMVDGTEYWMNAWIKKGKNGSFMSIAFKAKDRQEARKPDNQPARKEPDEDIPF